MYFFLTDFDTDTLYEFEVSHKAATSKAPWLCHLLTYHFTYDDPCYHYYDCCKDETSKQGQHHA